MENLDWEREHLKDVMYLGEQKFKEEQEILNSSIFPAKIIVQKQKLKHYEYNVKFDSLPF